MQRYRRTAALFAGASALVLAGCHHSDTDDTGHPVLNGSTAVATVNGQDITQTAFFTQLQAYRPTQQTLGQSAGQVVLQQMIANALVQQLAKDQGVSPTDADVDALFNTLQAAEEAQSVKPFNQLLAESGFTIQDVKDYQIRPQLAQVDLVSKGKPPITDAEISAFYARNKAQYTKPDRAHIKRIILQSPDDAKRIYSQIQQGQPFDSFVSQSLDRAFPGGDVPVWVNLDAPPPPQIVPAALVQSLKKATPGASPASVTPPFASQGLYWIVQVVETRPKEVVPLDQVKDSIRFTLMAQRVQQDPASAQLVQQQIQAARAKAKITIPDPRYATLLAQLTAPPPPTPAAPAFAPPMGSPAPAAPAPKPGG